MALGLGLLRLSPRDFWMLTPRELAAAMEPWMGQALPALPRGALDDLMRQFPDQDGGEIGR